MFLPNKKAELPMPPVKTPKKEAEAATNASNDNEKKQIFSEG